MQREIDFKSGMRVIALVCVAVGSVALTAAAPAYGLLLAILVLVLSAVAILGGPAKLRKALRSLGRWLYATAGVVLAGVALGFAMHLSQAEEARRRQEWRLAAAEAEQIRTDAMNALVAEAPSLIARANDAVARSDLRAMMARGDYEAVVSICETEIPLAALRRVATHRPDNAGVAAFLEETGSLCNSANRELAQRRDAEERAALARAAHQRADQIIADVKKVVRRRYPDALTAQTAYKASALELSRIEEPALRSRGAQVRRLKTQLKRKEQGVMYPALVLQYEKNGVGHVTATTLRRAFDKNEVDAERRYTGKKFLVEGMVSSINTSLFNSAIVLLRTGSYFSDFHGRLEERDDAEGLRKGQRVVLVCEIDTAILGSPTGSDCEVVMWWGRRN